MLWSLDESYIALCYIRHLSYCFYIAVNRICVATSRVDGALKPWSAIHLGVGKTKTCIPGFACSIYVKSASAAGAEEIITLIHRPKWRCSSMLWSMESMTRHKRSHGHPLHPGLAPDVLTLSCLWIQLGQDERVRLTARHSLTIIQFTAHVILISNTHSQQYRNNRHDLHSTTASRKMPGTECGPLHDLCRPYQSI